MRVNLTDHEWNDLALRTRQGNHKACADLSTCLGVIAAAYFRRRGMNSSEAEDLAVSCVSDVILALSSFRMAASTSFRSWAYGIIRRKRADHYRRQVDSLVSLVSDTPAPTTELAASASQQESTLSAAVADALAQLDGHDYAIVRARFAREPVEYETLSAELGLSPVVCRKRFERALKKLRIWLSNDPRTLPLRTPSNSANVSS